MKPEVEDKNNLRMRTRKFSLRIIKLYLTLPKSTAQQVIGKQLLRSGTSVGAHYAESCRSKSHADFINKVEGATQELEESVYWLDLLEEAGFIKHEKLVSLRQESGELMSIFVSMVTKSKGSASK